jgi:hypothetical protein
LCSVEVGSQRQTRQELLDGEYFENRKELESKGLEWGEGKALNKEKFKALMRIELRKSVSSQTDAINSTTYTM